MKDHIEDSRLNDLLDGMLEASEVEEVQAHLARCEQCRERLSATREVVAAIGALPVEAGPPGELWTGIRSRIDGGEADVLEFPGGSRSEPVRRVSFTWSQLIAAALALASVSGGTVWMTLRGGGSVETGVPAPALPVQAATDRYEESMAELEALIEAGRAFLAPETMALLGSSVAAIDRAIEEARTALEADPGSDLLHRLLQKHQRNKLRVLRRTAEAIQL